MKLRRPAVIAALLATLTIWGPEAAAQQYPNRPIRLIVPYPPGGLFDAIFRPLSQRLAETMGQPLVIDNRPGANTIIGMDLCAKSMADGYTLCATSNDSLSLNPYLYAKLPFDVERDFVPVTQLLYTAQIIVAHPSVPFSTMPELVSYSKANPGALNFSSFGSGSSAHMILAWINNRAGIEITHVPYKGGGPAVAAVVAGEVQLNYMGIGTLLPHIKAGRVKPIAVTQSARSALLPDVPTLAEQGMDFPLRPWVGVVAPAGTPGVIVERLAAEIAKIVQEPGFREAHFVRTGLEPIANTPGEFSASLKQERVAAASLVKMSGIRLEQ
jgi:tripartite-type tricarboxylate transporter receptor subunit TctC